MTKREAFAVGFRRGAGIALCLCAVAAAAGLGWLAWRVYVGPTWPWG